MRAGRPLCALDIDQPSHPAELDKLVQANRPSRFGNETPVLVHADPVPTLVRGIRSRSDAVARNNQ